MFKLLIVTALMMAVVTPAAARPQTDKKPADPNRTVCRTTEVIGSRLNTRKTCMTAVQWDQLEREQRMTVDKVQALKTYTSN